MEVVEQRRAGTHQYERICRNEERNSTLAKSTAQTVPKATFDTNSNLVGTK